MSEFDASIAIAYYAFLIFGSVTLGYAFLRLTQPEIRASPKRRKLLLSFTVGAAFAAAGIGIDYVSYGADRVLAANGLAPSFVLAAAVICLFVFKAASAIKLILASKRTMEVAVAAPIEKEGAARLLPFVQEVRKYEPVKPQPAAAFENASEQESVSSFEEEPLMEDIWTNKKIESSSEANEANRRQSEPTAPPWVKQELPPRSSSSGSGRSVRDKLAELKSKGVIEEMKSPSESGKNERGENENVEPVAATIMESPKLETDKMDLPKFDLPPMQESAMQASAPQNRIPHSPGKPEEKSVSNASTSALKVFGTPRYAKRETEKTGAFATAPQKQEENEKSEKKGLLQKITSVFSGGKKHVHEIPSTAPFAAAVASKTPFKQPPKPSGASGSDGRGDEQEIEVILSELHLVKAPTPVARKPLPKASAIGGGREAAARASSTEGGPAQRHRLYLERRGGAGGAGSGGWGGGNGRQSFAREQEEKQELTDLFSDVYAQVEKPGKPGAARAAAQRGAAARAAASGAGSAGGARGGAASAGNAAGEKALSVNDLFGSDSKPVKSEGGLGGLGGASGGTGGSSVFAQLDSLDASGKTKNVSSEASAEAQPLVQTVKMQVGRQAGCPHCGAKNVRVVFCPYCSTGMCANCTPNLKPGADAFVYTCPKCGEEVPVAREKKA